MFSSSGRLFAGAVFSVSLLASCSGGSPPTMPAGSVDLSSLSSPQPGVRMFGKWMYLAQFYGEDLIIYKRVGLTLEIYQGLSSEASHPHRAVLRRPTDGGT